MEHRRAKEHDIRITDDRCNIGGRLVYGTHLHRPPHGFFRAAEPRDMNRIAEFILQAKPERTADESNADDGEVYPAHTLRPTAGEI